MNNRPNNILSYFIKDIKDAKERAFYRQVNARGIFQIFYKDEILYEMINNCYNYKNNIVKVPSLKCILNYKIYFNYIFKYKYLYYKKDRRIRLSNPNYIRFNFIYNKYLKKINFQYIIDNKYILDISIIYYKKCKYSMVSDLYRSKNKFTSFMILIPNKYELHYYCKLFNLYFVINNY